MSLDIRYYTGAPVSRETLEKLEAYIDLLKKWNAHINLVAPTSLSNVHSRHIADSAQLLTLVPSQSRKLVDIGSGGGLPGIVLATLLRDYSPGVQTALIESDKRKATFLRQVIRELNLDTVVFPERIEETLPQNADVVTARALAPLVDLIPLARRHLADEGCAIFLKGGQADKEVEIARNAFSFELDTIPSKTGPGTILRLRNIEDV